MDVNALNPFEIRCTKCEQTFHFKLRSFETPALARCTSCSSYLNLIPQLQFKPNAMKLSFHVSAVEMPQAPEVPRNASMPVLTIVNS